MQIDHIWIFVIGILAQIFFSARILYQWIVTEKAGKIMSPPAFWVLSILGSYLLFIYGVLRNDFAIILGQFISYYIYLWNLHMQGLWNKINVVIRFILIVTPLVAVGILLSNFVSFTDTFFKNKDIPLWLLLFGSFGQLVFTLRFIYQFFYSASHGKSELPIGFWTLSLVGSTMIIIYALIRLDPVLIIGQAFGFVAYSRNIMIGLKNKHLI